MTAIWWIRRDLRVDDNVALHTAIELGHGTVIPLFVLDPAAQSSRYHGSAQRRMQFLLAGLGALDAELRRRGTALLVRRGDPFEVLHELSAQVGATAVVAERDHSPFVKRRDDAIASALPLHLVGSPAIRVPGEVLKDDGRPYAVFGAFRRAWMAQPRITKRDILPAPAHLERGSTELGGEVLPSPSEVAGFPAGPQEAQRRLDAFTRGIDAPVRRYHDDRDRMDLDGTSTLSPYLRLGMLSARTAAERATALVADGAGTGASRWLDELLWRDFYVHILDAAPEVLRIEFNAGLRGIAWRNDSAEIEAWHGGLTGYPVVDAAMRQLATTGWMHNRARMIVASFLVKHLLVDWRIGESWFMEQLIDGDPASNNGGWQWVAGTGTDAAPYFRVFNPVLQGKKFDPEGSFIRRWIPELANVPSRFIHEPWALTPLEQASLGVRIGDTYPAPIVDLGAGRDRALEAFSAARERVR
jgi:deoxyribodipyrimidine photo-lyase